MIRYHYTNMLAAAFAVTGVEYLAVIEDDMFPGGDLAQYTPRAVQST